MLKHMQPGPGPAPGQNRPSRGHNNTNSNRSVQPLNISTLSSVGGGGNNGGIPSKLIANGRMSSIINTTPLTSISSNNITNNKNNHNHHNNSNHNSNHNHNHNNNNNNNSNNNHNNNNSSNNNNNNNDKLGAREALTSLGLLCLVSLLLALLSLIFLLKISPGGREVTPILQSGPTTPEDYAIVYDVTLALCALSLSLNLCCLLVCAIQFLFAVKLVRAPTTTTGRSNKYLQKSSVSRVCAVGGFFISIPIFLTGIILYTFTQFQSTPAIITSALIGVGILFCGANVLYNVFVWQQEKTICVRQAPLNLNLSMTQPISTITPPSQFMNGNHIHLNHNNHSILTHNSQLNQSALTPVTPLSPNHSHISFNHSYVPSFVRAATATPPTPKIGTTILTNRDASGSVSPNADNTTTTSLHELSTLV